MDKLKSESVKLVPRKYELVYTNLIFFLYIHIACVYGGYLAFTKAKWASLLFTLLTMYLGLIGVVIGAHRLWSHKSFKAKPPLEIFLMICNSIACQYSAYYWVRDHRLHHKYSDTDADPTNASRGFFFAHIGWLLVKKHPEIKKRGSTIDMDDLKSNKIVDFQKRNAKWLLVSAGFIIPTAIPVLLWNEDTVIAWHLVILRYIINLHMAFCGNSIAHFCGYKPYDSTMSACQNLFLTLITCGEGFHNFHHVFPNDYRASEKGNGNVNILAMFVELCARFGFAYDLKEVSEELIMKRKARTGDGSGLWG